MRLQLPLQGVSDIVPASEKPGATTRLMVNMVVPDPETKKIRLSVRGGIEKFISTQVNGSAPVKAATTVTFNRKNITYTAKTSAATTPLGTSDVAYSTRTATAATCSMNDVDRHGDLYSTDGPAGIEKRNSALQLQWRLALPVSQNTAVVRALRVGTVATGEAISEMVFAGVSSGGRQVDAKLWGYKQVKTKDKDQVEKTEPEQVFELMTGAYTERIRIRNGLMYCAQNEPDKGQAWVRVYQGLNLPHPDLSFEFEVPYPIYDIDVRESDGAMVTAHPQNLTRGKDPRSTKYSARDLAMEWRLEDHLTDYDKRIWAHYRAADLGKALELVDGDSVETWPDLGPSFRSLSADTSALTNLPTWIKNGIGSQPSVRFSDIVKGLKQRMESEPNPALQAQYDDQQRTSLPAYLGARWAMFLVIRPSPDNLQPRSVWYQDNDSPQANNDNGTNQLTVDGIADSSITTMLSGTHIARGAMTYRDETVATNGEGGSAYNTGGGRNAPFPGWYPMSGSPGACVVSIINDGNSNTSTDAAQHSTWRLNGRPMDRWMSASFAGKDQFYLGRGRNEDGFYFDGDVAEMIVLREYPSGTDHTGSGNAHGDPVSGNLANNASPATQHYPRAVGTFGSTATTYAAATGNRYNDNEIERIEGMLAGHYGIAHLLPCGTASVLTTSGAFTPAETVTIGAVTYTIVAALTGAANEVLNGADGRETLYNLWAAINCVGDAGVRYSAGQTEHPTARATCLNIQGGGGAHVGKLKIETIGLTALACTETCAAAAWSNNPTSTQATVTAAAESFMPGHYPHPFNSNYGFPRPDLADGTIGATVESKGKLLTSTEGILARWDPQGKIVWVLTSRDAVVTPAGTLPSSNQRFGGIGFACQWGADGDAVYSVGDMYTTSPSGTSQEAWVRRVLDTETGYDVTSAGAWAVGSMTMIGNAANTHALYPGGKVKIDVDEYDNVYVPYDSPPVVNGVMSLVVLDSDGNVAWTFRTASGATNPAGACVSVDKKQPDYDGDPVTRNFGVYLGTRMGYTTDSLTQSNIYRVEPVSVTHASGVPPSETRVCAVSDGKFRTSYALGAFADPAGTGSISADVLADQADNPDGYVSMATLRGHVYVTDGVTMLDYDARKDKLAYMVATQSELKPRARGVCAWRDRLIWYKFPDNPYEVIFSASGNAYDYDEGRVPFDSGQAVSLSRSPRGTGQAPDIVNGLVPLGDDALLILCRTSIHVLDGDPGDVGSRVVLVSDSTGGVGEGGWCKDERGVVYIMGTRGCVYAFAGGRLTPISEEAIPERLRAIDLDSTRVMLLWDSQYQGVRVMLTPFDAADVSQDTEHYFWSRMTKGWYPFKIASDTMQPTATFVGDGDLASVRRAVVCCADGYMRAFSTSAEDDDGTPIGSMCDIGPLQPPDGPFETHFKELRAVLTSSLDGCAYQLFAAYSPDDMGTAVSSGSLEAGRNPPHFVQAVGSHVMVRVSGDKRYGIDMLEMDAYPAGVRTP